MFFLRAYSIRGPAANAAGLPLFFIHFAFHDSIMMHVFVHICIFKAKEKGLSDETKHIGKQVVSLPY